MKVCISEFTFKAFKKLFNDSLKSHELILIDSSGSLVRGQGKPDITFKKYNTVLFVNGCFWHMHDCKYGNVRPKTNTEFWEQKRIKNSERDKRNDELLKSSGWRVLTYWECEIKDFDFLNKKLKIDFFK